MAEPTDTATTETTPVDRRSAAMGELDEMETTQGESAMDDGDGDVAAPAVVAKPPEEPKPAPLSPQLAALAKQEKANREDKAALKLEREALAQERTKWEGERGSVDVFHREIAGDITAYADRMKWTPEQRQELATALHYSSLPEEKRPPNYRAATKVKSEMDVLREQNAKLAKAQEELNANLARKEVEAAQNAHRAEMTALIVSELPESTQYVKAFMKAAPGKAKADLYNIAVEMAKEHGEALTTEMVAKKYDDLLREQIAWAPQASPALVAAVAAKGAPLTQKATASPTQVRGPISAEERRKLALESIDGEMT